jgi:hypothetical protein
MKSSNGVLILVLGILSWVGFGPLTGIAAWVMGNSALKEIDAGIADPSERQFVQVGKILGMINTILFGIGMCIGLIFMVLALGLFGLAAGSAAGAK